MSSDSQQQEPTPATRPMLAPLVGRGEDHQSYLLRLWRSGPNGNWRASLQSVQTGERHMFAELESLLAFLVDQLRSPPTV